MYFTKSSINQVCHFEEEAYLRLHLANLRLEMFLCRMDENGKYKELCGTEGKWGRVLILVATLLPYQR